MNLKSVFQTTSVNLDIDQIADFKVVYLVHFEVNGDVDLEAESQVSLEGGSEIFFFQVSLKVDFQVDSEVDLAAARRVIQSITSSSFINSIQFNLESAVTIESTTAIPIPICYQFSNYSIEVNCWLLIGLD